LSGFFRRIPNLVIVDCAVYADGKRLPDHFGLAEAFERARSEADGFVWIGLHEPTFEEFAEVEEVLGLHPLAVEDAVHAHQRPKIERYDETLFVVLITARYVDPTEVVSLGEVMLFIHDHFVVTVRHGEGGSLGSTRKDLETHPDRLCWGPTSVLHAVMDRVVDEYEAVLAGVDGDVDEIEEQVFAGGRSNHAERIFKLKREAIDFRKGVRPLVDPMQDLIATMDDERRAYFRDVHDHLMRVVEHLETYDGILVSALNANLAQVGVQQNEDMRKISAWAGLITVPTLIAGIYGMNFQHMPELQWYIGYPFSLGLMAVVCWLLYSNFKKSGWL
jgi:magnesium transporter